MERKYYLLIFLLGVIIPSAYFFISLQVSKVKWSEPIRLTQDVLDELSPVFSPDGKKIAFIKRHYQITGIYDEIMIMNLETEKSNIIFSGEELEKICKTDKIKHLSNMEIRRLSWYADKIIFNTWCDPTVVLPDLEEEEIAKMIMVVILNEDGSNPRKIIVGGGTSFLEPRW